MNITSPPAATIAAAAQGDLKALDEILVQIQPGVFNLAIRMLGSRDDAADAAQEILLKVVTHLGTFKGESAFSTWVFRIARNHVLNAITRSKESPEVSLDAMQERLQQGLDYGESLRPWGREGESLTPEDKLAARQVALGCTQNMLMAVDREHRLVYLLDTVFGLSSREAGLVLDISPAAYRQRLARVKTKLEAFAQATCGLASKSARCQCEKQLPALDAQQSLPVGRPAGRGLMAIHRAETDEAAKNLDALLRVGEAAAIFRAHPQYQAPESMRAAIRSVLTAEGLWTQKGPLQ